MLEPITSIEYEDRITHTAIYSGEKEHKNYYSLNQVYFKETGDIVWVLLNGAPSEIKNRKKDIEYIVSHITNEEPVIKK